jgi:solute carrier family 35, member E1
MLELGVAVPLILASWQWSYRGLPPISPQLRSSLAVVSLLHALGMYCTALSLVAGAVSFVHIVKASEPVFAAVFSFAVTKKCFSLPVYLSLAPIIVGVCFASLADLTFSLSSFTAALCSNIFYQLRVVLFKVLVIAPGTSSAPERSCERSTAGAGAGGGCESAVASLSPSLSYRVMTVIAFFVMIPIALLLEGGQFWAALRGSQEGGAEEDSTRDAPAAVSAREVLLDVLLAGLSYSIYNEVARQLSPVCLCVCLSVYLSVCLFFYLSVSVSISLFIYL